MQPVQLKDFLNYRYLSGLVASPDQRHCAFVSTQCDLSSNGYRSYLHLLDVQSRAVRQLTFLGGEKNPVWLDDHTLLFSAMREPELQKRVVLGEPWTVYYALDIRGGEAQPFLRLPKTVHQLLVVDENRFALVADHDLNEPDPHTLPAEARDAVLAARKARRESYEVADELPFRHNGLGFHNGIRSGLYLFDRRDGSMKRITEETQNVDFVDVRDGRIIYSAKRFDKSAPKRFLGGICVYDVDEDTLHPYVDEDTYRIRFCSFLKGVPVFMGSDGLRYGYQENPYFFAIDEATGKESVFAKNELSAQNATGTDSRYGSSTLIEASGDAIYYVGTVGGDACLKRVTADGAFETLTDAHGAVDGIAVLSDEIILIAMRENRMQELYVLRDGRETRISDFNEWLQTSRALSTPEPIAYENEGRRLEGWVMKPVGYDENKTYPGILYIHGGHKLAFGSVFYHEMQVWAGRGYFVFFGNPFGSDGGDNDFADLIGKYGFEDYRDLMALTDTVLLRYPALDKNRLGVGGGSYGGYMTNWVIGHTNRFACAVSQRSIASFISMFGTSDTSYLFPVWAFDTDIWMDVARYWQHSPLKYADQCKTPTLFIHAEEDYRCPVSEGVQMYSALKYNGVEARLCLFKGENHELSRSGKPVNRIHRLEEITQWFDSHLC